MRTPLRHLAPLVLVGLALAPELASACAVCIAGQTEETRYAFLWTTGFLSVLPVGMIGLAVWWLRRRLREQALQEQAGHAATQVVEPPEAGPRARRRASGVSRAL
jgi:hypothetical protein